jgi:hypothetical protein
MKSLIAGVAHRSMVLAQHFAEPWAEGAMNTTVRITRSPEPIFDEVTRELGMATEVEIYGPDGPEGGIAGIYATSGPVTMALGDEPQYYSSTTVSIPRSAPNPRIDDVVEVLSWTTGTNTEDIVGRLFRVVDVEVGGRLTATTRMQAIGIAPSRQWGA